MAGPVFVLCTYQADLIQERCSALKQAQSPLIVLPTGGGETALIAELTLLARKAGRRVTLLCHRHEILLQINSGMDRQTGQAPELVAAGTKPCWSAPVIAAMVPIMVRRLG